MNRRYGTVLVMTDQDGAHNNVMLKTFIIRFDISFSSIQEIRKKDGNKFCYEKKDIDRFINIIKNIRVRETEAEKSEKSWNFTPS